MTVDTLQNEIRPVKPGILAGNLSDLSQVHLAGSECSDCKEVALGEAYTCPNCGGDNIGPIILSDAGKVWTYTIVRHRPPGDYKGPEPFVPFAMGLVELPDGIRVLAPIGGPVEGVKIGMDVVFRPVLRGDNVVEFIYNPKA